MVPFSALLVLCAGNSPVTGEFPTQRPGVVSLTFRELSKIISRKSTMLEITFRVRISSRNFVCVPKAWLWAYIQSFSLTFSQEVRFLRYTNYERIFWRARETLVKQPPVTRNIDVFFDLCLKQWLSEQWWGWWFETPSRSLWCHCNVKEYGWHQPVPRPDIYHPWTPLTHWGRVTHMRQQNNHNWFI